MILSYEEAQDKAIEYLNGVTNVRMFCDKHNLGYQSVINMRNKRGKKQYTNIVLGILTIFGNDVTTKVIFEIKS